ncbi:MAG: hypothetical protein FWD26_05190 [Treponema sp.]|nr:hypothetical protein [Treponema sp.]
MAIKKIFFILCALFVILLPDIHAQNYFIDTESGQPRFVQRLTWSGGEFAARYEIIIEREVSGRFIEHLREFTRQHFVEVSLPPGEYRFRVIPYDFFDRPAEASEWKNVSVRAALQPQPAEVLPEIVTGERGETLGFIIEVTGSNLDPDARYFIRYSDGTQSPLEVTEAGEDGVKVFAEGEIPDQYEIIIRNPGGLEARIAGGVSVIEHQPEPEEEKITEPEPEEEKIIVQPEPEEEIIIQPEPEEEIIVQPEPEEEKIIVIIEQEPEIKEEIEQEVKSKFDPLRRNIRIFGISYTPALTLYGNLFEDNLSLFGLEIGLGVVFLLPLDIYIGPEITVSDLTGKLHVGVNLLALKWLPSERFALGFRLGASYSVVDFLNGDLAAVIGASFNWRLTNNFLFKAGFDFLHFFNGSGGGSFRAAIGVGHQY